MSNTHHMHVSREIILDLETTGLSAEQGDKIIEIACVELIDMIPSGTVYHQYINPQRSVSTQAELVHGISSKFLQDKPKIHEVIDDFLDFIQTDPLVIHNARFDVGFLNYELASLERPPLSNPIVDTLTLAKQQFPSSPVSLDALCRRFQVSLAHRQKHGALIDCELLAKVYWHLKGAFKTQSMFARDKSQKKPAETEFHIPRHTERNIPYREPYISAEEKKTHAERIASLPQAIWHQYKAL